MFCYQSKNLSPMLAMFAKTLVNGQRTKFGNLSVNGLVSKNEGVGKNPATGGVPVATNGFAGSLPLL
jgi:hypothetical protein